MRSIVVVPAVCFALGVLVGLLVPADRTRLPSGPEAAANDGAPWGDAAGAPAPRPPARAEPGSATAPAAAPEPGADGGTVRVSGRVRTPKGAPVPGVVVTAWYEPPEAPADAMGSPEPPTELGPPATDPEFEMELRYRLRGHATRVATRRETISARDGTFSFAGLPDAHPRIRAWRKGYEISRARGAGGGDGEEIDLVARVIVDVPIRVARPDGSAPESARLRVEGFQARSMTWSPTNARIRLLSGSYELHATADDGRLASRPVYLDVEDVPPASPVLLTLAEVVGLRGIVTFPPGATRAFCDVVALSIPPGANASPKRLAAEGSRQSLVGGRGNRVGYALPDLAPGRYLVGVVRLRREVLASAEATVADGMTTVDFLLPGGDAAGSDGIAVHVLGPDGRPVPWCTLRSSYRDPHTGRAAGRTRHVGPGEFRIVGIEPGPEIPKDGHYVIDVRSDEFGPREVEFDPRTQKDVTIRLEAPARLTLVLDGYVGSRYEGNLRAVVAPPETAAVRPGPWDPALEPDGHQEFGPFPPGDYVLSLWMGPYAPFLERRLTLASGPRELHLALPPIYVLDVRIEGPEGDQGFYLERLDGPAGYAAPRVVDGRFLRFEGLVAGEYVLSRHHGPRQHMPLTITGDRVVTFKPIVLDAMRVTVADPEGPLARGGFVDGDLVLAIDGTEIRGETQGYGLLRLAVARGSGTFSLVRGGKRRDVEVRLPEEVLDPAKAGGEIRPWTR